MNTPKLTGYRREDGKVGIRNEILVVPSVVCANVVAEEIARSLPGTKYVTHPHGCATLEPDLERTKRTVLNFALNPNVGGIIVVGLGCEGLIPRDLADDMKKQTTRPVECLIIQDQGTDKTIEIGKSVLKEMAEKVLKQQREEIQLSELTLGLECGGSDVTSGLASNPVIGLVSDYFVENGATVILSETSELIGTENVLANRCKNDEVKEKLLHYIKRFEDECLRLGTSITGGNPSPGNMEGGLTTIEEKSLGCVYKGGHTIINEVIDFAELPREKGLIVMDTPGHDIESITGEAAGGAQICLFSTGRGTPMGCPIMPTLKICGNAQTVKNMGGDIDIDVSPVMLKTETLEQAAERALQQIFDVINGKESSSEKRRMFGFGINRMGPSM